VSLRPSEPPAGERPSRVGLEAPNVRPRHAWLGRLGVPGALIALLALVAADFALGIRLWISIPLTAFQTFAAIPWLFLVLRAEAGEIARSATRVARLRARLAHLVSIVVLVFALGEKWAFLVRAAAAESPEPFVSGYRSFAVVALLVAVVGVLGRGRRAQRFLADSADHPARLMVLSFGLTAFVGGFLLSLPGAVEDVRHVSLLDALFTATSAVCVTGLAVNDVPATYTLFGEIVILA
jgi:trk system potassium uptake protein TrkH